MVPPVDPYSPSSFGSTFADAPGMLRENGWTESYHVIMNGADNSTIGICSGSSPATNGSTLLPLLTEGQTMNIYGIQGQTPKSPKDSYSPLTHQVTVLVRVLQETELLWEALQPKMVLGSNIWNYLSKYTDLQVYT